MARKCPHPTPLSPPRLLSSFPPPPPCLPVLIRSSKPTDGRSRSPLPRLRTGNASLWRPQGTRRGSCLCRCNSSTPSRPICRSPRASSRRLVRCDWIGRDWDAPQSRFCCCCLCCCFVVDFVNCSRCCCCCCPCCHYRSLAVLVREVGGLLVSALLRTHSLFPLASLVF